MVYHVHNGSRATATRTTRANNATHRGLKQFIPIGQRRVVRGRPVAVTDEELAAHLEEMKTLVKQGLVYVTTTDGRVLDLETMQPAASLSPPPMPAPPLDDASKDPNFKGVEMAPYGGEKPPPKEFSMPVAPPSAAVENPLPDLADENLDDRVTTEVAQETPAETPQGKDKKKGGRR